MRSDEQLMTSVQNGELGQLAVLFDRYHQPLFKYCIAITGSAHIAEDCVQEAFRRILQYRSSYRAGRFKLWLYRIARMDTLRAAGVRLAVGTNAYGSTLTDGLITGIHKGFHPAAEMLRIATMVTPSLIFPNRKVGCLDVGCEASFIAFGKNPIEEPDQLRNIVLRIKDGQEIEIGSD